MIKLTKIEVVGDHELELTFNDGRSGRWSAASLIARDTVLTQALCDTTYFARAFVEAGALAWPNGLELSPTVLAGATSPANTHIPRIKMSKSDGVVARQGVGLL